MAEKEEPVVDNETGKIKVKAKAKKEKQPTGKETKGDVTKVKAKMTQQAEDVSDAIVHKVNLDEPAKKEENEAKEDNVDNSGVVAEPENAEPAQEQEEVQPQAEAQETPVVEEITKEEQVEQVVEKVEEAVEESIQTGKPLPESIQKLVDFMDETGGDITDYVTLNQDYSKLDNHQLLKEYYKSTKPHLSEDEIEFVMEYSFSYDEDESTEKEIKRKKLAMKEQVAQARQHLESVKSKYYEDIKAGSKLTEDQQKAIDFFNNYNKESENYKKQTDIFNSKTNNLFNKEFKGFEYNVGDKRFRFNVNNAGEIKEKQSDIGNFIGKFLNENNQIEDAKGYHKALYTAMNSDAIAKHFY